MRAAVIDAVPGVPAIGEVDLDEPGIGEVLVRTAACGLCHSDLSSIDGSMPMFQPPFVLGHEAAGVVEAVGPDVVHLAPGDHVVATLVGYCGHCAGCMSGIGLRCTGGRGTNTRGADSPRLTRGGVAVGQHCDVGGFAERLLIGHHNVISVDPALPFEQACLLGCGVMTGAGAVLNTSPVSPGASVAVIGCGGVGLAAIQAARIAYAAEIVAVDIDDAKLDLAQRCGATRLVNASSEDPVAVAASLPGGGVDFVYEAIGRAATVQQALAMTAPFGTCTVVGMLPLTDQVSVGAMDLMMGKTLRQSLMGSARPAVDIPMLVDHTLAGRLDLAAMVDGTRSLDDLPAAVEDLAAGRVLGRTVVTF